MPKTAKGRNEIMENDILLTIEEYDALIESGETLETGGRRVLVGCASVQDLFTNKPEDAI